MKTINLNLVTRSQAIRAYLKHPNDENRDKVLHANINLNKE